MQRNEIVGLILKRLEEERDKIDRQWNNPVGTTTRHFYVDNLLPAELVENAYAAFPSDGRGFVTRETFREKKLMSAHISQYSPLLGELTYAMQDPSVISKISDLVGIDHLEPDPSLYAGGLSIMVRGDFLNPHIDNSHDAKRDRYRRLNLLFYISPEWQLENGGNFELWNEDHSVPVTVVAARNRLLVMETNKSSWHSVSKVVVDRPRCCVSNYYFSKISPDQTEYFHVTSFDGRPNEPIKKIVSVADNALRNMVSRTLKIGRGKGRTRPPPEKQK